MKKAKPIKEAPRKELLNSILKDLKEINQHLDQLLEKDGKRK